MLRLRLDLTAFKTQPKEIFWRLERVGILHKTVEQYVGHLLREYGIDSVQPMVYLDGTYLPETESPFIFRDGDVLRILPRNVVDKNSSVKGIPESFPGTASKSTVVFETPVGVRENGDATHPEQEESETLECATESAETSELLDPTDISESGAPMPKKRKRGKRPNRLRSKRVSFDVLADENGGDDKTPHLESTPFRNRVSNDAAPEAQNGSSVETRSGCYVTALEDTSGVSRQSKTPMKTTTARKEKKIQSGVGYYLNLLGSGDSSLAAGSSADSVASPDTRYLKPGPSNCSDSQRNGEGSRNTHDQSRKDGSLLAALPPNSKVSCVIGMFDVKTAGIQRYSDVTLEILCNYPEKKSSTVRLIEGYLPSHVSGSEFKVDWGMISSVNTL